MRKWYFLSVKLKIARKLTKSEKFSWDWCHFDLFSVDPQNLYIKSFFKDFSVQGSSFSDSYIILIVFQTLIHYFWGIREVLADQGRDLVQIWRNFMMYQWRLVLSDHIMT